jgi:glycine/D-amino acid oxidase-like deaminating enzyme
MLDCVIVGGGIFGKVIAKELGRLGMSTLIIDARLPNAGSPPAACLMKHSWLQKMRTEDVDAGFETLDRLYGLVDLRFALYTFAGLRLKDTMVRWVPPHLILGAEQTFGRVQRVLPSDLGFTVVYQPMVSRDIRSVDTRHVVIATGSFTPPEGVAPVPGLVGKAGISFRVRDLRTEAFIRVWAPYKQMVTFSIDEQHTWIGDGTAILEKNWDHVRAAGCWQNCERYLPPQDYANRVVWQQGLRPSMKVSDPCHLSEPRKGLLVATGGAKNGTLAAGWVAHQIGRRLT